MYLRKGKVDDICNGGRDQHNTQHNITLFYRYVYSMTPAGYSPTGSELQALSAEG